MFDKLFPRKGKKGLNNSPIIVVSGLPRSGTSMMMNILKAGGIEILTDHLRASDEDNPEGYLEFERVKQLRDGDSDWVLDSGGKAIKVISSLLEYLPKGAYYKIIFLERDINEILDSQKQMLIRRGEPADQMDNRKMIDAFLDHLTKVKYWLARQNHMLVHYVNYNELIMEPRLHLKNICYFIDGKLDLDSMLAVPKPLLYRHRLNKV